MAENEYNKALHILREIALNNPERMDEVQGYIDVIMRHQEEINTLKQNIIDQLYKNHDDEKAFFYMEELKKKDPKELGFIQDAYQGMLIVQNLRKFNGYMDTAYQQLTQARFREAIDTYKQGFTLYRDEFFENKDYGNITRTNTQSLFIEFDALVSEYYSKSDILDRDVKAVNDLIAAGRYRESVDKANDVSVDMFAVLVLRSRMINIGKNLKAQNENIKKASADGKGANFLFYSYQVVLGRIYNSSREGVFYVFEKNWEIGQDKIVSMLQDLADRIFVLALQDFKNGNFDSADASFLTAGKFYSLGAQFLGRYLNTASATAPAKIDSHDKVILREKLPLYYYQIERALEAHQYRNLIGEKKSYEPINSRNKTDEAVFQKSRAEIRLIVDTLTGQNLFWNARVDYFHNLTGDGLAIGEASKNIPELLSQIATLLILYQKLDLEYSIAFANGEYKAMNNIYSGTDKRFTEAKALREGTKSGSNDTALKKYPSKALEIYTILISNLNDLGNRTGAFKKKWGEDYDYIVKDSKIHGFIASVIELEKNMRSLRDKIAAESALADDQIKKAASLRNQGDFEFKQAKEAFARSDYARTKDSLDRSVTAFTTSLSYEENSTVHALLDGELNSFINETYKASIDQRKRDIKTNFEQGKELYTLANFEKSEQKLTYAQKLQKELYGEEDLVITYWITLVQRALKLQPKREISEKDPAYPEMTKRLNLATEDYQAGLENQAKGNTAEANKRFQNAIEKINQIKIEYPYHRESGVLFLKVIQAESDKPKFQDYFRDRMMNAIKETNLQKAYADLRDLEEIDPIFPGLKDAINNVGNRIYGKVEPKPAEIAESNRLYEQAVILVNRKTQDSYMDAKKQLDQALILNPNNTAASNLKERIISELPVVLPYVISAADQKLLLEANRLFLSRDYLAAGEIVRQLMLNPVNQNNPRIINLQKKIEANR